MILEGVQSGAKEKYENINKKSYELNSGFRDIWSLLMF